MNTVDIASRPRQGRVRHPSLPGKKTVKLSGERKGVVNG